MTDEITRLSVAAALTSVEGRHASRSLAYYLDLADAAIAAIADDRRRDIDDALREGGEVMRKAVLREVGTEHTIERHGVHCECVTCVLNRAEREIRRLRIVCGDDGYGRRCRVVHKGGD